MRTRRSLLLLGVLAALSPAAWAQTTAPRNSPGGPDLKTTLEKGLKVRRKSEFAFVALVVQKVHAGQLPVSLVNSSLLWARKHQPYPFPYFQQGLRARAKKAGITI